MKFYRLTLGRIAAWAALPLLLSTTATTATATADDQPPASTEEALKAIAEAGKPGPEHARLQPLAGKWTYTGKFWMDPSQPPIETKGVIERKWILGGRFLEETVSGTGFDGQSGFEGRGLMGYDNGQKKFTYTFACSMGTGTSAGVGEADASGGTIRFQTECYCPVFKKNVQGRDVVRIESNDKVVIESYMIHEGQEMKVMELTTVRQK